MVTTYNTVSADGFIARKDGSEDFIPDDAWDDFLDVLSRYDVVVMGRKTYEAIQKYPSAMIDTFESVPIKRAVVSQEKKFVPKKGYFLLSSLSGISASGKNVLITSGPSLNTAALQAGIIDRVMLNVIPETIGEGMAVFNAQPKLMLISTENKSVGRKLCTYKIDRA